MTGKVRFICSDFDPSLFISNNITSIVYVDNALFFSPFVKFINEELTRFQQEKFHLQEEDDVADFFGCKNPITLTIPGLIDRIILSLEANDIKLIVRNNSNSS
jgi:hypothetical protein